MHEEQGTSDSGLSERLGHDIINLSTKDTTYSPSIIPTIHLVPDNLSTKNKWTEFKSSPKCPLFRGSPALCSNQAISSRNDFMLSY